MNTSRTARRLGALGLSAVTVLAMAGCGSNDNKSSGGASSAAGDWTKTGPINYVQGKDTGGHMKDYVAAWNKLHPDQKVTLVELSDQADAQRQSMIQNAQNKGSSGYDVMSVDVVWTAEFAANGVIRPLPSDMKTDQYMKSTVDAGTYYNKLYAYPYVADGAMLYYRSDLLKAAGIDKAPTTWDEMKADCTKVKAMPGNSKLMCYGGQFQKYEGLTCNLAEWINGAGGQFLDADGKPQVNSDAAVKGVSKLQSFFKDGTIPAAAQTWTEEPVRTAFEDGQMIFQRNWAYVYAKGTDDPTSKVKGKFAVAPIPGLTGTGVSTLGGHNLAISPYSKNLGTAKAFIEFMSSPDQEKTVMEQTSNAPAIQSLYSDPKLVKDFPYLPTLYKSVSTAKPRPKAVHYGDVTTAIENAGYSVITNTSTDPKSTLDGLQSTLTKLTAN